VPPIDFAALGAFLSGVGAVLSSVFAIRRIQRRAKADCDERVAEVTDALREGLELGRK